MSVPIAVVGEVPKMRISNGVIRDPPPMPVMPTSTPIQSPKRTIAGFIGSCWFSGAPHGVLLDFLDFCGRECGVRKDNRLSVVARGLSHSYGELRSLDSVELEVAAGPVVGL